VFLEFEPRNLRDIRDRALVAVAYDTMCRRKELVSLLIEDIESAEDGSGTVVIRRSKTDVAGEGATAYLSPLTMRLLTEWLQEIVDLSCPGGWDQWSRRCPDGADRNGRASEGGDLDRTRMERVGADFGTFGAGGGCSRSSRN
jgi:integrase